MRLTLFKQQNDVLEQISILVGQVDLTGGNGLCGCAEWVNIHAHQGSVPLGSRRHFARNQEGTQAGVLQPLLRVDLGERHAPSFPPDRRPLRTRCGKWIAGDVDCDIPIVRLSGCSGCVCDDCALGIHEQLWCRRVQVRVSRRNDCEAHGRSEALPSSTFVNWSGGCAGAAPTCTLPLKGIVTVRASFSPVRLWFASSPGGVIRTSPAGRTCGAGCTDSIRLNRQVARSSSSELLLCRLGRGLRIDQELRVHGLAAGQSVCHRQVQVCGNRHWQPSSHPRCGLRRLSHGRGKGKRFDFLLCVSMQLPRSTGVSRRTHRDPVVRLGFQRLGRCVLRRQRNMCVRK